MKTTVREAIAYHEAGHAVVACATAADIALHLTGSGVMVSLAG